MFNHILILCIGNICRSPMAEGLFTQHTHSQKIAVQIGSAGIGALTGHYAHPIAQKLMQEIGSDISSHRARQLTEELLVSADLILVMDIAQMEYINQTFPFARGRVYRLGKWSDFDVPDPYGKTEEAFRTSFSLIEQGFQDWKGRLWK